MKSKRLPMLILPLALWALATITSAQNYSITWSKIAGGGGTSTGGVYSVSGTLGPPDAGASDERRQLLAYPAHKQEKATKNRFGAGDATWCGVSPIPDDP
jgi:hypothetical protein